MDKNSTMTEQAKELAAQAKEPLVAEYCLGIGMLRYIAEGDIEESGVPTVMRKALVDAAKSANTELVQMVLEGYDFYGYGVDEKIDEMKALVNDLSGGVPLASRMTWD